MSIKKTLANIVLAGALALGIAGKAQPSKGDMFPGEWEIPKRVNIYGNPGQNAFTSYIMQDGQQMLLTMGGGTYRADRNPEQDWWGNIQLLDFSPRGSYATLNPDEKTVYWNVAAQVYSGQFGDVVNGQIVENVLGYNQILAGNRLYFYTPSGNYDIFYSELLPNGAFTTPRNLSEINTGDVEQIGYITPDHKTMLFMSNRPGGQGSVDIWKATWNLGTSEWENPENLGATVNDSGSVGYVTYCPGTQIIYFNRGEYERWQSQGIPEPSTLGVLAAGGLAALLAGRRKRD